MSVVASDIAISVRARPPAFHFSSPAHPISWSVSASPMEGTPRMTRARRTHEPPAGHTIPLGQYLQQRPVRCRYLLSRITYSNLQRFQVLPLGIRCLDHGSILRDPVPIHRRLACPALPGIVQAVVGAFLWRAQLPLRGPGAKIQILPCALFEYEPFFFQSPTDSSRP